MSRKYRVVRQRFVDRREEFTAQRQLWFGAWVGLYWLIPFLDDLDGMFSARFDSLEKAVDAIEDVLAAARARDGRKPSGERVVVWPDERKD